MNKPETEWFTIHGSNTEIRFITPDAIQMRRKNSHGQTARAVCVCGRWEILDTHIVGPTSVETLAKVWERDMPIEAP